MVIKSVDRLGRDYKEILEEWRKIVRTKGVDIEVIDLPLLNTTQEIDGIAGVLIADILTSKTYGICITDRTRFHQEASGGRNSYYFIQGNTFWTKKDQAYR